MTHRAFVLLFALSSILAFVPAQAVGKSLPVKEWTILVFLNADNNLDSFGVKDLGEMQKVGSTDQVNVVVQMDRLKEGAKRYFVRKGAADVLADLGEVDMGDYKGLVEFAKWGATQYPSKRTMVIVWNHGSGWDKRRGRVAVRGVSYDDSSGNNITTEQLGVAMGQIATHLGRRLDILGFDACLMNMFEVAYEVRANVTFQVGSEETEPGDGWPYSAWLKSLTQAPTQAPMQLATTMVKAYASSYWISKATQSAIFCPALERLREKTDLFVTAIQQDTSGEAKQAIASAKTKVARFAVAENADFFDLVQLFKKAVTQPALKAAADAVLGQQQIVVTANAVHAIPFDPKNIHGLAVYFPRSGGWWSAYRRLAFAKDSKWDELLSGTLGAPLPGNSPFDALHGIR
ncbi:MAG: hypothetical protein HY815_12600 [Candidatus Riflebacteria bacterium]|nr:hypothetical protein [Candidatus Riflebacteria bacterium]